MHTNCFYNFKTALYYSAKLMKGFNISRKSEIITVKLKVSLLLNALLSIHPFTFINEALHLSGSLFVASTASSWFSLAGVHNVLC